MQLVKAKHISYEAISKESGIALSTVKRCYAGKNITSKNLQAITSAHEKLRWEQPSNNTIQQKEKYWEFPIDARSVLIPKEIFSCNLLWSSDWSKPLDAELVISAYIRRPILKNFSVLYWMFGKERCLTIAKKTLGKNKVYLAHIKHIFNDFDKWRLSDAAKHKRTTRKTL